MARAFAGCGDSLMLLGALCAQHLYATLPAHVSPTSPPPHPTAASSAGVALDRPSPALSQHGTAAQIGALLERPGSRLAAPLSLSLPPSRQEADLASLAERHRRILNAFLRQDVALLDRALSPLLKFPRLVDFDNKRAFFTYKTRQLTPRTSYGASLRIALSRARAFEDSFQQVREDGVEFAHTHTITCLHMHPHACTRNHALRRMPPFPKPHANSTTRNPHPPFRLAPTLVHPPHPPPSLTPRSCA